MCVCLSKYGHLSVCFTLQRNNDKSSHLVLPSLISAVGRLAQDEVICHDFAHDPECWKAFLIAIVSIITDWSLCTEKCEWCIQLDEIRCYNTNIQQY